MAGPSRKREGWPSLDADLSVFRYDYGRGSSRPPAIRLLDHWIVAGLQSHVAMNWPTEDCDGWLIQSQCHAGFCSLQTMAGLREVCARGLGRTLGRDSTSTSGIAGESTTSPTHILYVGPSLACATGSHGRTANQSRAAPPATQSTSPPKAVLGFMSPPPTPMPRPPCGDRGWRCCWWGQIAKGSSPSTASSTSSSLGSLAGASSSEAATAGRLRLAEKVSATFARAGSFAISWARANVASCRL